MNRFFAIISALICAAAVSAQTPFSYKGTSLTSGEHCLYVNSTQKTKEKAYTFHTVNEALSFAQRYATDSLTSTAIYIEPSVYWIDDPDDKTDRVPYAGDAAPFGLKLKLNNVRMIGLSENPEDVVLACNRGQTQGADGNFTMLYIKGNNISAENLTFGNYCNVDLDYKLNPKLNRRKRNEAIVQAQLVICSGRNYTVNNCRFISRLNLCPFAGADDITFEKSYFECTDDALAGNALYKDCSFTFYSSKPFYTSGNKGTKFVNCDIYSKVSGTQYLTKVTSLVEMENCRWTSDDKNLKIEWSRKPDPRFACKTSGCTLNGNPLDIPTPTEALPFVLPAMPIAWQDLIIPGRWTMDAFKPIDTMQYSWKPEIAKPAWGYCEGEDGAEGSWGIVQIQKGARIMFTPKNETDNFTKQQCIVTLDPCKSAGQGFGSATGQYLDICLKFNTRTLSGYGIRFVRTPDKDHSVEAYLVEYMDGNVFRIGKRYDCQLFRAGCVVDMKIVGEDFTTTVSNTQHPEIPAMTLTEKVTPNTYGGFHLQHTGSTGASATVIKSIKLIP